MTRTWTEGDRVATLVAGRWQLGTVTGGARWLVIRWDAIDTVTILGPDDQRVVHEHEVPIDERHWVPEKTRDQLIRQEAAARLRAMAAPLLVGLGAGHLRELADDLAEFVDNPDDLSAAEEESLTAAARALLTAPPIPVAP